MDTINLSQINLLYLMSVKEMVTQDIQLAQIRTGLSTELLNAVLDCSIYQLQELADSGQLVISLRGSEQQLIRFLEHRSGRIPHIGYLLSLLHSNEQSA